ncbi:uncharacterized protein LOC110975182 isoform X1 [Acanthaster planci]|uniref:N-terminal methionine N(alpha)-acetyltransferase NatC n=1 Tax=Acanthaster planci TaxID=133434 RepID=A0A8B7XQK1_ACAPL|nr:uncharacterized protein LOC110975182 isoform X1 [Acanthaster planci]
MSTSAAGGVVDSAGSRNQHTDLSRAETGGCSASQVPGKLTVMNGPEGETIEGEKSGQHLFVQGNSSHRTDCSENCIRPTHVACHASDPKQNQCQLRPNQNECVMEFESKEKPLSNECLGKGTTFASAKFCSCSEPCDNDNGMNEKHHLGSSGVQVPDNTKHASSEKILMLKTIVSQEGGVAADCRLTNGCCDCHLNEAVLKTEEHGKVNYACRNEEKSGTLKNPNSPCQSDDDQGDPSCNCTGKNMSKPLSDLTKMVENICLESDGTEETVPSLSLDGRKQGPTTAQACQEPLPCSEQATASGDLLTEMDQSFSALGPAGGDLDDAELEEFPSSLSDFVLSCHSNRYTVPPCPANDSDINTIHIHSGSRSHPVTLVPYKSELQMPDIMRLITKDLSEPYSIYTYRYFIHNWPQLCFLAMHQDKCVGAIVCKLDIHKKMARRGYIAMLAVDENYRKLQIGSSLVKKAIRAMVRGECDEVVLETEITNKPALRLYENLGFLRDKRLFRYYLNGVDALRLKLWLR